MKLAFRTAAVAQWDFAAAARAAGALGYDGVELYASFDASVASGTNVLFSQPDKIRGIFADAAVGIASVSVSMKTMPGDLSRVIEATAALGATMVRVIRADAATRVRGFDAFAAQLLPLADIAAAVGVTLLLENEATAGSVSHLWRTMDGFNHPAIACCWSPAIGRLAGESPLVSIPTLNSRIRMVWIKDATAPEIPIRKILQRLAGIGFAGWLLADGDTEENLRHAQSELRQLLTTLKPPQAATQV